MSTQHYLEQAYRDKNPAGFLVYHLATVQSGIRDTELELEALQRDYNTKLVARMTELTARRTDQAAIQSAIAALPSLLCDSCSCWMFDHHAATGCNMCGDCSAYPSPDEWPEDIGSPLVPRPW